MKYLIKFNDGSEILEIPEVVAVEMYGVQDSVVFYTKSDGIKTFPKNRVFSFVVDPNIRLPR